MYCIVRVLNDGMVPSWPKRVKRQGAGRKGYYLPHPNPHFTTVHIRYNIYLTSSRMSLYRQNVNSLLVLRFHNRVHHTLVLNTPNYRCIVQFDQHFYVLQGDGVLRTYQVYLKQYLVPRIYPISVHASVRIISALPGANGGSMSALQNNLYSSNDLQVLQRHECLE